MCLLATAWTLPAQSSNRVLKNSHKQQTLKKTVSISGIGLFTGEKASLEINPADVGTGIIFQRIDLSGKPSFRADLDCVVDTPRCTILGNGSCTIYTVEHVLAALSALGIDNALLKLSGPEVPIMDGSAISFVDAIIEAGLNVQKEDRRILQLKTPMSWTEGEVHLVAIPSDEFRVSYTLHFPQSTLLRSQYYSAPVEIEHFIHEIASSRTFCFYEEITPFIEDGSIKGGGLNNAVIIKNDVIINPNGTRFTDEMVRHKILDLIGDLKLIPELFLAHIIAIRSGHTSNIAFANKLYQHLKRENA